jgi:hypothetical protein
MLKALEIGWNCSVSTHEQRDNGAGKAYCTNRALTKAIRVGRGDVITDDVEGVYRHVDTPENEGQIKVLVTRHIPKAVFRVVAGALDTPVNRIGHLTWYLGIGETGIQDGHHLPSSDMRHN